MRTLLLLLLVLMSHGATAQVEQVREFMPGGESGSPGSFTIFENDLFFSVRTPAYGSELWRYDGVSFSLALDAIPGPESVHPIQLRPLGDQLFFLGGTSDTGAEPWLFDGEQGFLVRDIWPGPQGLVWPLSFAVLGDRLFFRANDVIHGFEQWVVEGDSARMVADINPGVADAWVEENTVYDGFVYFSATDPDHGSELWRTDGTTTELVEDIVVGAEGSSPLDLTVFQDRLYFSPLLDGKREIWETDGSTLRPAKGFSPGESFSLRPAFEWGNSLYLHGFTDETGAELWRYDGESVEQVADLEPGPQGSYPAPLGVFNQSFYLSTCDFEEYPDPYWCRLWRMSNDDRFVETFTEVGAWWTTEGGPNSMVVWDNHLYITVYDPEYGSEIWRLTEDTVELVTDLNPGSESGVRTLFVYEGQLLFSGNDGSTGLELWRVLPTSSAAERDKPSAGAHVTVSPNPVWDAATLRFSLDTPQDVTLEVFSVLGRRVRTEPLGALGVGEQVIRFEPEGLPSGAYRLRLIGDAGFSASQGLILHR